MPHLENVPNGKGVLVRGRDLLYLRAIPLRGRPVESCVPGLLSLYWFPYKGNAKDCKASKWAKHGYLRSPSPD